MCYGSITCAASTSEPSLQAQWQRLHVAASSAMSGLRKLKTATFRKRRVSATTPDRIPNFLFADDTRQLGQTSLK
jgi:hypothetical protein